MSNLRAGICEIVSVLFLLCFLALWHYTYKCSEQAKKIDVLEMELGSARKVAIGYAAEEHRLRMQLQQAEIELTWVHRQLDNKVAADREQLKRAEGVMSDGR